MILMEVTNLDTGPHVNNAVIQFDFFVDDKTQLKDTFEAIPKLSSLLEKLKCEIVKDDKSFLEFISYYQELPEVNSTLKT